MCGGSSSSTTYAILLSHIYLLSRRQDERYFSLLLYNLALYSRGRRRNESSSLTMSHHARTLNPFLFRPPILVAAAVPSSYIIIIYLRISVAYTYRSLRSVGWSTTTQYDNDTKPSSHKLAHGPGPRSVLYTSIIILNNELRFKFHRRYLSSSSSLLRIKYEMRTLSAS